jgi:hypothetical protein
LQLDQSAEYEEAEHNSAKEQIESVWITTEKQTKMCFKHSNFEKDQQFVNIVWESAKIHYARLPS